MKNWAKVTIRVGGGYCLRWYLRWMNPDVHSVAKVRHIRNNGPYGHLQDALRGGTWNWGGGFHYLTLRRKGNDESWTGCKIASEGGITKSQADKAVDDFVSAVSSALSAGDKITLVGFGTFSVGSRAQREGHNPRTGKKITIPASKAVKFKAGKTLSEKVK